MDRRVRIIVLLAALLLPRVAYADWQWEKIAWDGYTVWSVASPPDSGDVIYVSIGEGPDRGVHKSTDGGLTWRFLPESRTYFADQLSINPSNQAEIYCGSWSISGTPGAWPKRSRDAGEHWEEIAKPLNKLVPSPWNSGTMLGIQGLSSPLLNYVLQMSTDDGASWRLVASELFSFWLPGFVPHAIFHAADSLVIVAPYISDVTGEYGLGRSTDKGWSWSIVVQGGVGGFDQDPFDPDHWLALAGGFKETHDSWETHEGWNAPGNIMGIHQLAFDRSQQGRVYLVGDASGGSNGGVRLSDDGAHTWTEMNEGFEDPSRVLHMAVFNGRPGEVLAAATDGLWKWTDGARADPGPAQAGAPRLMEVAPCPFETGLRVRGLASGGVPRKAAIYDMKGSLVRLLSPAASGQGRFEFFWDGCDGDGGEVPAGSYVVTLDPGSGVSRIAVKARPRGAR